jgi:hypothetical protein
MLKSQESRSSPSVKCSKRREKIGKKVISREGWDQDKKQKIFKEEEKSSDK